MSFYIAAVVHEGSDCPKRDVAQGGLVNKRDRAR